MKRSIKIFIFIIALSGIVFLAKGLVNPYWLPREYRSYFQKSKYESGRCVASKRWGVPKKRVLGMKLDGQRRGYLLRDNDRYEHAQYISKIEVDKYSELVPCR